MSSHYRFYRDRLPILDDLGSYAFMSERWRQFSRAVSPPFTQWLEQLEDPQDLCPLRDLIRRIGFPKATRPLVLLASGMDFLIPRNENYDLFRRAWVRWIIATVLEPETERQRQIEARIHAIKNSADADSLENRKELLGLDEEMRETGRGHWLIKLHFVLLGLSDPLAKEDGVIFDMENHSVYHDIARRSVANIIDIVEQPPQAGEQSLPSQALPEPKRKTRHKGKH